MAYVPEKKDFQKHKQLDKKRQTPTNGKRHRKCNVFKFMNGIVS